MKLRSEVSAEKLRGGYYTPPELVSFCWRRIRALTDGRRLRVLEPTAGDGQFLRSIDDDLFERIDSVTAIEVEPSEAAKCRAALSRFGPVASVHPVSFLSWALNDTAEFDVAVGNPPFVRFQFVGDEDSAATALLGLRLHLRFEGVSNLWIPVLLSALGKLTIGGAFSFVVPAEVFTGLSAGVVRRWLLENTTATSIDLFPAGSFGGVLQEVVVLSGRRVAEGAGVRSIETISHRGGASDRWTHQVPAATGPWTRLLMTPRQAAALEEAVHLSDVQSMGSVARVQVSIVTGANDYFCVDTATRRRYHLTKWCVPLLPRARHATGLVWTTKDQRALAPDVRSSLVHFADDKPSPERSSRPSAYLALGRSLGIHTRYKCRIRTPWYRVPDVWAGSLLLSKRSHRLPRLFLNSARVVTTDTIYRGRMTQPYRRRGKDLVAGFHNSLTLLTSELEGRSFGGGVHELVPSEIARLSVPMIDGLGSKLPELDRLARRMPTQDGERALVTATDELLVKADVGLSRALLDELSDARESLMWRRLERSSPQSGELAGELDLLAV